MTTPTTPTESSSKPQTSSTQTPETKRASGISPLAIVLIFGALLGGATYGVYTLGSSLSGDQTSAIDSVVSGGPVYKDGPYSRSEAYTKMFSGVFKAGAGLAATANLGPQIAALTGGAIPGMDSGATAPDMPYVARQLSQEEIDAMNRGDASEATNSDRELSRAALVDQELQGDAQPEQQAAQDQAANDQGNTAQPPEQQDNSAQVAETAPGGAIQSQKYVSIGKPALFLGDSVIYEVAVPQSDGSYGPDQAAWQELAQQQFTAARINRFELARLANVDINSDALVTDDVELVKKFIRLFYYGSHLDKGQALGVLLEKVHPSIKQAVISNPDLSANGASAESENPSSSAGTLAVQEQAENTARLAMNQAAQQIDQAQNTLQQQPPSVTADVDTEMEYEKGRSAANGGNFVMAMQIWKPLAEQGLAKAQTSVGRMYARGDGVAQNYSEALRWFQLAAGQGDDRALLSLGKMYLYGHGVAKNKDTAANYLSRAMTAGNKEAKDLLKQALG